MVAPVLAPTSNGSSNALDYSPIVNHSLNDVCHDDEMEDETTNNDEEEALSPHLCNSSLGTGPRSQSYRFFGGSRNSVGTAFIFLFLQVALLGAFYRGRRSDREQSLSPSCPTAIDGASRDSAAITYDPLAGRNTPRYAWNPATDTTWNVASWVENATNYSASGTDENLYGHDDGLGYIMQPDIANGTIVFVSDGDLYWTTTAAVSSPLHSVGAAARLTTTIGNVRTPKINPYNPDIVACTATYQATRDVYLYSIRGNSERQRRETKGTGATPRLQRLTYSGINTVVNWINATTLLVSTHSTAVGLPDTRLYQLDLLTTTLTPVPLAQARDGMMHGSCYYVVRFRQYSWTARYVGGTAESLWAYCDSRSTAVALTADYPGTSRQPMVVSSVAYGESNSKKAQHENTDRPWLLFMSDRSAIEADKTGSPWQPATMNLWAVPLPTDTELYNDSKTEADSAVNYPLCGSAHDRCVQLTRISCQFNGMPLSDYAVDSANGNILLRIGGHLYQIDTGTVRIALATKSTPTDVPTRVPIHVLSDYKELQERHIAVSLFQHLSGPADIFVQFNTISLVLPLRGQVWVAPVNSDAKHDSVPYQGAGQNIPLRRYRVLPGAMMGGAVRVLATRHIPSFVQDSAHSSLRLGLVLATDPFSDTAEHAFYLIELQADATVSFSDARDLPIPFCGGHLEGGSIADGGLGSVNANSVVVSPCGRRFAWTDTDDRICVMTLPMYERHVPGVNLRGKNANGTETSEPLHTYKCLPRSNDIGEPMAGVAARLTWSPGGQYLAVEHRALNQFSVLTIADCGTASETVELGRMSQVTPSRFNSYDCFWGVSALDVYLRKKVLKIYEENGIPAPLKVATTLYFLSDRDVVSDVHSPWGSRAPSPHFPSLASNVYAFPLPILSTTSEMRSDSFDILSSRYPGEGMMELFSAEIDMFERSLGEILAEEGGSGETRRRLERKALWRKLYAKFDDLKLSKIDRFSVIRYLDAAALDVNDSNATELSLFPQDPKLDLPEQTDNILLRKSHRIARIPKANYLTIVTQSQDDGSLLLAEQNSEKGFDVVLFAASPFPSDNLDAVRMSGVSKWGLSTCRKYVYLISPSERVVVVTTTASSLRNTLGGEWEDGVADTDDLAVSVWPTLEHRQIFGDAWRMLRDYFYDKNMHNVNWKMVYARYSPLVSRCSKREELDDVLGHMISELSALHTFVYGGEYMTPDQPPLLPATLGVSLKRSSEWKGYMITEIPQIDPDFDLLDDEAQYCPVSTLALRVTGQKGLQVGDVIVAVNGESTLRSLDLDMMLRGFAGRSVRLQVLRLGSGLESETSGVPVIPEPLIVVPITRSDSKSLQYGAWEWKTRQLAKSLASKEDMSIGYVHMRAMDRNGEDAFARAFFPDYDKDALIIDVRHNSGGNIDSWILSVLQKKAWMYWGGRGENRIGDLDWDEQFAFRGKIVVLIDEHTSSNGEGLARGVSELGLGKLVGKRTWGGGIWGSSANRLVDGGIAAAPQWGTFNSKFGWGGGVEMKGVDPDVDVDNDPRMTYDGRDQQLERAISVLKDWISAEPTPVYKTPDGPRPDMSLHNDDCPV